MIELGDMSISTYYQTHQNSFGFCAFHHLEVVFIMKVHSSISSLPTLVFITQPYYLQYCFTHDDRPHEVLLILFKKCIFSI